MMDDMDPKPEHIEHPPRNLRTNYQETLDAIASMENNPGSRWLAEQAEDMADLHKTSFPNARRWLENKPPIVNRGHFDIGGNGGVNRWRVYRDGRVTYFLDEENKAGTIEGAQRARELGFEVDGTIGPSQNPYASNK